MFRDILPLKDGGQVALDWLAMDPDDPSLPVLIIMPGLTG